MRKRVAVLTGMLLGCALALSACGSQPPKTETTKAETEAEETTKEPGAAAESGSGEAKDGGSANTPEAGTSEEAPVYVYLTRHGETLTNRTARMVSGRGNTPLTEAGRQVASTVGVGLSGIKFTAAYSSPLGRTRETARLILDQSQTSWELPITSVEGLRELDGGSFEPMGYGELMQDYGMKFDVTSVEDFQNQFHDKDETGQAESYAQATERAVKAFKEICTETAKNGGGNVLMVAHGGINGLIASEIMGQKELESLANSSVVLIEYKDGAYQVLSFNDQTYGDDAKARMENPEPVEVYLMVHAKTVTDDQERMNGVLDADLTGEGAAQAKEIGKQLADLEFRSVHTSDQFKDVDTARLVIGENAVNPDLKEHSSMELRGAALGYFDGELREKARAVVPASETARNQLQAFAAADPTGMVEDYDAAKERLLGAFEEICKDQRGLGGGKVLVVSSGLACQLIAEELDGTGGAIPMESGDIVRITWDGSSYQVMTGLEKN